MGTLRSWPTALICGLVVAGGTGAWVSSAAAATVPVGCSPTSLVTAIASANTAVGATTLSLAAHCPYSFGPTAVNNYWYGANVLPAIANAITIEGNGATLSITGPNAAERFFFVGANPAAAATLHWATPGPGAGNLTLEDLTLQGGTALGGSSLYGGGGLGAGGAIYNQGSLTLDRVTLTGNTAQGGQSTSSELGAGGGGIYQDAGATTDGGGFGPSFSAPGGSTGAAGDSSGDGGGGGGFTQGGGGGGAGGSAGTRVGSGNGGSGGNFGGGGGGGGAGGSLTDSGGGGGGSVGGGGGAGGSDPVQNFPGGGGGFGGFGGGGGAGGAGAVDGNGGTGGSGGFGGGGGGAGDAGDFAFSGEGGSGGFGGGAAAPGFVYLGPAGSGGGGAGMGGAVFSQAGSLTIEDSTFTSNAAQGGEADGTATSGSGLGGAVFAFGGSVSVLDSTLDADKALSGGSGAIGDGGELYALAGDAPEGAGSAQVTLENSILADSTAAQDLVADSGSTVTLGDHNLVPHPTHMSGGTILGTSLSGQAHLGVLAGNGGPGMQTMLPGATSAALRAGDPKTALAIDERGIARLVCDPVDLGAIQVTPTPACPTTGVPGGPGGVVVPPVGPATSTQSVTFANQLITLVTPSLLVCTASSKTLTVTLRSVAIPKSHAAHLRFSSASFYIGKGIRHVKKRTRRLRNGKRKTVTIVSYVANATAHHVPVTLALKLGGLKSGTQTLRIVISYKKTVTKRHRKHTVTVTRTLKANFRIC